MFYEIGYFGDERLKKIGELLTNRIVEKQTVKLRQLGETRAGEV